MRRNGTAIWNGEFGPVHANAKEDGRKFEEINQSRISVLRHQLKIYMTRKHFIAVYGFIKI